MIFKVRHLVKVEEKLSMRLGNLRPAAGRDEEHEAPRQGRGERSGWNVGKATRARRPARVAVIPVWFEGGQMPIQRRLPKRGFVTPDASSTSR